jgi:transcriptional regulator with XRE-family HTH domain
MQAFFNNTEKYRYSSDMPGGRPTKRTQPKFGQRLAALRMQQGLSQSQFAKKLNIKRELLAYYERYAKNPTIEFVERASNALQVSTDELLSDHPKSNRKPGPPSRFHLLADQLSHLPRNKQKAVIEFLEGFLSQQKKAA